MKDPGQFANPNYSAASGRYAPKGTGNSVSPSFLPIMDVPIFPGLLRALHDFQAACVFVDEHTKSTAHLRPAFFILDGALN